MNKPLVSIITVCYNAESTIKNTLNSVLCQSFKDFEYIIVDGASIDNTCKIVKEYKKKFNNKIKFLSEPDNGIYDAMNKAIKIANGEWFLFIGADDLLIPECLSKISKKIKTKNTIYYGDVYLTKEKKIYDGFFNDFKIVLRNICHQSILYYYTVFEEYNYNIKNEIYADYELNLLCFKDKSFRFEYISELLTIYNNNDGLSNTKNINLNFLVKEKPKIIKEYYPIIVYFYFLLRKAIYQIKH